MTNLLALLDSLIDDDEDFTRIKKYISYWNPFIKNDEVLLLIKQSLNYGFIEVAYSETECKDYLNDWFRLTEKGKIERINMLEDQGYE